MNIKSKMLITAVAVLCFVPLSYAGRGPDEAQFQQRFQKMDKLIEQADAAKTPVEREKLLEQHMQEMRACMNMMKSDNAGMGMGMGKATDKAPMDGRMMQMEQRMDTMQMMMDQMMKQQGQAMKMMK